MAKDQGVAYEDEALHLIAQKADGAMRDALSIFDRMSSFCNQNLTAAAVSENLNILDKGAYLEFTNHLIEHNIPESLMQFDSILQKGIEGHQFMSGLAIHFRDLLISKDPKTIPLLEISESLQQGYADQAKQLSLGYLLDAIDLAHGCELNFKNVINNKTGIMYHAACLTPLRWRKKKGQLIPTHKLNPSNQNIASLDDKKITKKIFKKKQLIIKLNLLKKSLLLSSLKLIKEHFNPIKFLVSLFPVSNEKKNGNDNKNQMK